MQISDAPGKIVLPFANGGSKNTIPVNSSGVPGSASFDGGFPPETMLPVPSGGVPPAGLDFNGIFFDLSGIDRWISAGAGFPWDSAFSAAVGGYPKGARVLNAGGTGYWISLVDNNTTDPDTGGGGWGLESGSANASVYASAQQTLATPAAKIIFNTVEYDANSLWDATNHRFKAIFAGKYRFSGAVYLPAPDGQSIAVEVWKNGAISKRCLQMPQVSNVDLTFPFDAIVSCNVNDYIEAYLNASQSNVLAGVSSGDNSPYVYGQLEYLGT